VTVYRKPFPVARPAPKQINVAEQPKPSAAAAAPMGPPAWLDGLSPEEHAYRAAVARAMAPKRWEPEEDPLTTWLWGE
jgi:hypothetical protein